jgi:hypothetical protein
MSSVSSGVFATLVILALLVLGLLFRVFLKSTRAHTPRE